MKDIKFKAKVDNADIEKLTDDRKKLIGDESKLLEDHRKANKEILTRHFYDMSNMMSRNEGVWLSNDWVKVFLWIFLTCSLSTVIPIVIFSTRNLHSFEKEIWEVFNNYGEDMPSLSNISPIFFCFMAFII